MIHRLLWSLENAIALYDLETCKHVNVMMDGLLISLIHNNVTHFDFLDYLFVTAFLYMYSLLLLFTFLNVYVWWSSENATIHRFLKKEFVTIEIDSNVLLVELFCLPICYSSL